MPQTRYRDRRAVSIENGLLRVTVLEEGGHVAEIFHKPSGVNPLWTPPWPSIEPSEFDHRKHSENEDKMLAGIMGHNLCLDIFGEPSKEEAEAGLTGHGEASIVPYQIESGNSELIQRAELPKAQLRLERQVRLRSNSPVVEFTETVENLGSFDRPVAWTQHVTLGPPFLEKGQTQFRAPATRSRVLETDFAGADGYMKIGADFDWPNVPLKEGGFSDLRIYTDRHASGGFTTQLMDPHREHAYFVAWSPRSKLAFGYVWTRTDFPWLGIWEENHSRSQPPWNRKTLTRGMEFGASPMPETRRQMIERGSLFGVPGYRWIPARRRVEVRYRAAFSPATSVPEALEWSGNDAVQFA